MTDEKSLGNPAQCLLLLPGYELDNYPRSLPSEEAATLLSGWASLWHPALLQATQAIPAWQQAGSLPAELAGSLILVPEIANSEMDSGFENAEGCLLLSPRSPWRELQAEILERYDLPKANDQALLERFCEEFAALGYAYLQIQLMTRQLRYTSNLDQLLFADQVVSAAEACLAGEETSADERLQACFDTLGQERDHYYSLDVHLLDVTLLAPSVLGKSLSKQQAASSLPTSYLASAEILRELKDKNSDAFEKLRAQIAAAQACIVGGLEIERQSPLMPRESLVRDLAAGRIAYEKLELDPPRVFGRMSFGLTTDNAADLKRHGYDGVFLIAWSEGAYPEGSQTKISWESSDGTFISAIASEVRDSSDANSFLSLGWDVGDALDHQHVPTIVFAHWPNRSSEYYRWLQVIARRTPALGRWAIADNYFRETDDPYHQERLNVSEFKQDWLTQSSSPWKLLSGIRQLHQLSSRCRSLQNLWNLIWQLEKYKSTSQGDASAIDLVSSTDGAENEDAESEGADDLESEGGAKVEEENAAPLVATIDDELEELLVLVDSLLDVSEENVAKFEEAESLADQVTSRLMERLRNLLSNSKRNEDDEDPSGRLLVNSRSFPQRVRVQSAADTKFQSADWNYASGRVGHDRYTCVDLPAFGFVVAAHGDPGKSPKQQHLAELGGVIQNEFLEAQVDRKRGHLRSFYMPGKRGNRLSLMVARRDRVGKGKYSYSEMQAKDVRMLTSSNVCGLIRASGKLVRDGKTLGEFEIDYESWRGSRVLEVAVRLSQLEKLADRNPWNSAYVLRLAWATDAALLRSYQSGRRHPWPSGKAVSPALIEIDESDYCTHFLTGGLSFHRRTEMRFLETLLEFDATKRESECRIGIGVDLPHPLQMAEDFLDRRYSIPVYGDKLRMAQGWLANADVPNVIVHFERPIVDEHDQTIGLRMFVQECEGTSTNAMIRLMHNVKSARRVDYLGIETGKLSTNEDAVTVALRANEQCNVDVLWG
ncbi:MAG: hypothetical protein AAF483_16315 [Planctomycetota bacterium]